MISIKNLTKSYGNTKALKSISFQINKGEIIGFLGPNGAGKTTTMKILACYMDADSGEARIGGFDCCSEPLEVKKIVGYLPESNPLYQDMLVLDYLKYIASIYGVSKNEVLDRIKVTAKKCGISDKLNKAIGELSKGYKQRVGIASVLLHDPQILILDEPTVGLDPNQIIEIRALIKELARDKTIIFCSHILSEVEATCGRIVIINDGKIIADGTPNQIRKQGKQKGRLKVSVEGKKQAIADVFKSIDGIVDIHQVSDDSGQIHEYELEIKDSSELRKKLVRKLLDNKCDILELHLEESSLEDAFTALTK